MPNKSAAKALVWLRKQGYTNVVFRPRLVPNFITDQGRFMAKRAAGSVVMFYPGQARALQPEDIVVVFTDASVEPVAACAWDAASRTQRINDFYVYICPGRSSVWMSDQHRDELYTLQRVWKCRNLDEVMERLLGPQRLEELKALPVELSYEEQA